MTKNKTFLKDKMAGIIFTDTYFIEYVEAIISKILDLDFESVHGNLTLITPRVNANFNTKGSTVDAAYETNNYIINIEVNFNNDHYTQDKNGRYVCNLILKQDAGKNKLQKYYKNVTQININNYDYFHKGDFIYKSILMETKYHLQRSKLVTIYDINMDFLNQFQYNEIEEVSDNSLEKLLYPLICDNINDLKKLYKGNRIMEKVTNKMSVMQENWYEDLYYDPEELRRLGLEEAKEEARKEARAEGLAEGKAEGLAEGKAEGLAEGKAEGLAEGKTEGILQAKTETIKNLFQMGMSKENISQVVNLSIEEITKF